MAPGDVTITRGVGARDDGIDANLTQTNSGSVSGTTVTTDGDTLTFSGTFTNPAANDQAYAYRPITNGPLINTPYSLFIIRSKIVTLQGNFNAYVRFHMSDGTVQTVNVGGAPNSSFVITSQAFPVYAPAKTLDQMGVVVAANALQTGTFNFSVQWDFVYVFKETLTLPAVSSPLTLSLSRYVIELPIPTREGGIIQDLGSASGQLEVDGTLITTTSPNNYTGDQWWDVLVGTWLEANWQWLTSDRVSYKYQIESLTPTEEPGKVGYYGFKMKLRKVDIITASAQTFGSATGTGAIQ